MVCAGVALGACGDGSSGAGSDQTHSVGDRVAGPASEPHSDGTEVSDVTAVSGTTARLVGVVLVEAGGSFTTTQPPAGAIAPPDGQHSMPAGVPATTSAPAAPLRAATPVPLDTHTSSFVPAPAPQPAGAPETPVPDTDPGWEQRRGEEALAAINYPWQRTGYQIRFEAGRRGVLGLTNIGAQTITVYVRPEHDVIALRYTLAHEIGHAVDLTWGNEARREDFAAIRGYRSDPWFGCGGCTDYETPAGDWAEVFGWWLVGHADFRSAMAGPPSPEQMNHIEGLFAPTD